MISRISLLILLGLLNVCTNFSVTSSDRDKESHFIAVPAFPGAEGGGMYTSGGRGGQVIRVSNLNDSGPGSLRDAVSTSVARTIVFDVSGTIELKKVMTISHGDLTIAGQTAPGDGICIKGHEVRIEASNIIIRFIRFRPGDISGEEHDALTGMGSSDIMIDHCSMSWSTDETVSFYDNENFSLQWSVISESLNNSVHSKGAHGYGGIWGGKNASFVNNVLAHHNSRNPRLQGTRYNPVDGKERLEMTNNIVYNWGDKAIYGGENGQYNIKKNIFIPGPATVHSKRKEMLDPYQPFGMFFLEDNVFMMDNGAFREAGWEYVTVSAEEAEHIMVENPFPVLHQARHTETEQAYHQVLAYAGASLVRDPVDLRIIREIRNRTYTFGHSGIIDSQEETGGWPVLRSRQAAHDSDGDGIPDEWEVRHHLNPNDPSDGNAYSLESGYTNLEVFLNELVKDTFPAEKK